MKNKLLPKECNNYSNNIFFLTNDTSAVRYISITNLHQNSNRIMKIQTVFGIMRFGKKNRVRGRLPAIDLDL